MSLGQNSIAKRVAKPAAEQGEQKQAATPKAPAKKAPAKKAAPKTAVLSNIAPETVEKVVGRKEMASASIIRLGDELPAHLL